MPTIFTIGYAGVSPENLITSLVDAGVHMLVDVRLTPYSESQPAYCRDALAVACDAAEIGFVHDHDLGNPVQERCRQLASLDPYKAHMRANPEVLNPVMAAVTRGVKVALLCGCLHPDQCHRGVIADAIAAKIPGMQLVHLRPPLGAPRPALKIYGLTLHQPWCWCICYAGKRIENRDGLRPPAVGTYLAIHAGKKTDRAAVRALRASGIEVPDVHVEMAIMAVARFAVVTESAADPRVSPDQVRWWSGPRGWLLDEVVVLAKPVPVKGMQGLWRIPDDVLAVVRAQWKTTKEGRR